jgi:hypothetical protein
LREQHYQSAAAENTNWDFQNAVGAKVVIGVAAM